MSQLEDGYGPDLPVMQSRIAVRQSMQANQHLIQHMLNGPRTDDAEYAEYADERDFLELLANPGAMGGPVAPPLVVDRILALAVISQYLLPKMPQYEDARLLMLHLYPSSDARSTAYSDEAKLLLDVNAVVSVGFTHVGAMLQFAIERFRILQSACTIKIVERGDGDASADARLRIILASLSLAPVDVAGAAIVHHPDPFEDSTTQQHWIKLWESVVASRKPQSYSGGARILYNLLQDAAGGHPTLAYVEATLYSNPDLFAELMPPSASYIDTRYLCACVKVDAGMAQTLTSAETAAYYSRKRLPAVGTWDDDAVGTLIRMSRLESNATSIVDPANKMIDFALQYEPAADRGIPDGRLQSHTILVLQLTTTVEVLINGVWVALAPWVSGKFHPESGNYTSREVNGGHIQTMLGVQQTDAAMVELLEQAGIDPGSLIKALCERHKNITSDLLGPGRHRQVPDVVYNEILSRLGLESLGIASRGAFLEMACRLFLANPGATQLVFTHTANWATIGLFPITMYHKEVIDDLSLVPGLLEICSAFCDDLTAFVGKRLVGFRLHHPCANNRPARLVPALVAAGVDTLVAGDTGSTVAARLLATEIIAEATAYAEAEASATAAAVAAAAAATANATAAAVAAEEEATATAEAEAAAHARADAIAAATATADATAAAAVAAEASAAALAASVVVVVSGGDNEDTEPALDLADVFAAVDAAAAAEAEAAADADAAAHAEANAAAAAAAAAKAVAARAIAAEAAAARATAAAAAAAAAAGANGFSSQEIDNAMNRGV